MCDEKIEQAYEFKTKNCNASLIIDTDSLFLGMVRDLKRGESKKLIATKFHNSMAEIIVSTVKRLSKQLGIKDIALSGGVFQNRFLTKKINNRLPKSDFNVFINSKTPVNDLNISLGQYYVSCHTSKN